MSEPVTVLYCAGAGRSGNTRLVRIRGQVPGQCSVGEVKYVRQRGVRANEKCGCGGAFRQGAFWHGVLKAASGRDFDEWALRMDELSQRFDRVRHVARVISPWKARWSQEDLAVYRRSKLAGSSAYCVRQLNFV